MKGTQKITVLCIFTKILGGKTFSSKLANVINENNVDADFVYLDNQDYKKYIPPFYTKFSDAFKGAWIINEKIKGGNIILGTYDSLYFQGYQLTIPFLKFIKQKPTALALDHTPRTSIRANLKASKNKTLSLLRALLTIVLDIFLYKNIFKEIDFFLARTEMVANSLHREYGVSNDRIAVTYTPQNVRKNINNTKNNRKISLLFVGNDFVRKGGDFLLEIFDSCLASVADLTIISTDSSLKQKKLPLFVTLIPGCNHDQIYNYYQKGDIFVFPTFNDALGLVTCEAISQGMAVISRDAGAQGELVINEFNGFLMEYESTSAQWHAKLIELSNNRAKLQLFKKNSLEIAAKKLIHESFKIHVESSLKTLQLAS